MCFCVSCGVWLSRGQVVTYDCRCLSRLREANLAAAMFSVLSAAVLTLFSFLGIHSVRVNLTRDTFSVLRVVLLILYCFFDQTRVILDTL